MQEYYDLVNRRTQKERKRQKPMAPGQQRVNPALGNVHAHVICQTVGTVNIVLPPGDPLGDIVKAGSAAESELIRKTILENADLRRMLRTIENAPAAIFHLTKGTGGAQAMRNVRKEGQGRACELREDGLVSSSTIQYCKTTAVRLVEELRRAVDSVTPQSPEAVREWASDVTTALRANVGGRDVDYVTALRMYCDASSKFYKLTPGARDAIAGGVRDIAQFISDNADF